MWAIQRITRPDQRLKAALIRHSHTHTAQVAQKCLATQRRVSLRCKRIGPRERRHIMNKRTIKQRREKRAWVPWTMVNPTWQVPAPKWRTQHTQPHSSCSGNLTPSHKGREDRHRQHSHRTKTNVKNRPTTGLHSVICDNPEQDIGDTGGS